MESDPLLEEEEEEEEEEVYRSREQRGEPLCVDRSVVTHRPLGNTNNVNTGDTDVESVEQASLFQYFFLFQYECTDLTFGNVLK
jgi:hypothetical protein